MGTERLEKLQRMLEREPDDPFLLYGAALEYKKLNDAVSAIGLLDRVIGVDPGYCYAYHQKGLIHESTGNLPAAREAYRQGIAAAIRKGDAHAQAEIEEALSLIERVDG